MPDPFFVFQWTCSIGFPLLNTVENNITKKIKENKFSSAIEIKNLSRRQLTDNINCDYMETIAWDSTK